MAPDGGFVAQLAKVLAVLNLPRAGMGSYPTEATEFFTTVTSDYLPPIFSNTTAAPSTSDGDAVLTCPHCDRKFTSHIDLFGHLRIHRTETGELVPGAPTHSRDHHLYCPRAVTHRMGLIVHMDIHESGIHLDANTSCAPINTSQSPPRISTISTRSRPPQAQHLTTYLVLIVTAHAHHESA
ncbi:unnamed protein product [Schistocephalus solidus]|uniref:C2H2-type domain-containing protein n=1 Tax=Schistocephalus solidus TaxID=70667 RepID=A0A183T294_SCHSO|nr:unnamed protein product [Schistocephalus solidus]